jgi:hypothetical protein
MVNRRHAAARGDGLRFYEVLRAYGRCIKFHTTLNARHKSRKAARVSTLDFRQVVWSRAKRHYHTSAFHGTKYHSNREKRRVDNNVIATILRTMAQTPRVSTREAVFKPFLAPRLPSFFTSVLGPLSNAPPVPVADPPDCIPLWVILHVRFLLDPWPGAVDLPWPRRLD